MSNGRASAPLAAPRRGLLASRCTGVSLVEMMVALAVGAIVVLGLAEILANTSATYSREEAFARLQENGRIASAILTQAMQPSRSLDCKSLAMHTRISGSKTSTLSVKACALLETGCTGESYLGIDRPLGFDNSEGLDNASAYELPPAIATSIADRWVLGDVVVAWGVDPAGVPLNGPVVDGSGDEDGTGRINLKSTSGLGINDIAVVSNCKYAHVFEITGLAEGGKSVEHAADLRVISVYEGSSPYNRDTAAPQAMLYPLDYRVFYICCVSTDDGTLQTGGSVGNCRPAGDSYQPEAFRPALCVYDLQRGIPNQQLVPDVADLRVTYSADTNGDGDLDFRADDAASVTAANAWSGVRSAAVELLLTTESDNSAVAKKEPQRPSSSDWPPNSGAGIDNDTLGADYPADQRVYQRFRFDVALRPSTLWTTGH